MEMPSTSRLHVYSRFQCFQSLAVKKGRNAMTGTEKRSRHVRRGRGREPKTFEPRKESKLMPVPMFSIPCSKEGPKCNDGHRETESPCSTGPRSRTENVRTEEGVKTHADAS